MHQHRRLREPFAQVLWQPRQLELLSPQQLLEDELGLGLRDRLHGQQEGLACDLPDESQLRAPLAQPISAAPDGRGARCDLFERPDLGGQMRLL